MNLTKHYLTENDCYKAGKKIDVKGLMIHSTGANNPKLSRYIDDPSLGTISSGHWNTSKPGGRQVCVHGFIGKDKEGDIRTIQTLPWNHRGWGGGGSSNNTHIHIEICEAELNDEVYFKVVYKEAVELFAYLCKKFDLTEKDVTTHCDGYKKGIASNHGDVMHWFPKHGKDMDDFRADIKKALAPKPAVSKPVVSKPVVKPAVQPKKKSTIQLDYKRTLAAGSEGIDVKELQTALNKLNFKCGTPDGKYGLNTRDAVKRFQSVHLPYEVDGVAGKNTINKVNSLLK
jgi:N-acetyl-anhydromuramyl-L-alanine amidase AmpD